MSHLARIAQAGLAGTWLSPRERSILENIADCQSGRLGKNTMGCSCGHVEIHNNSCRDRHCPICQGAARAEWVEKRLDELLPCPYVHAVFTIPQELREIAYANKALFYQALFTSVHNTLLEVGANTENLGARLGGMTILHTWNQKLAWHPHIHVIVPGGGVSLDGLRWIPAKPGYLLPVRRLSMVFRGKLLSSLEALHNAGKLYNTESIRISLQLKKAAQKDFVVYAKQPFGGPDQVLKYLGRYTHRVGISDSRIVSFDGKSVVFSWLDRAHGNCRRECSVELKVFLKKFLLHIIPKGVRKIRYFGFMANRDRTKALNLARELLAKTEPTVPQRLQPEPGPPANACPCCGQKLKLLCADRWRTKRNIEQRLRIIQVGQARIKLVKITSTG